MKTVQTVSIVMSHKPKPAPPERAKLVRDGFTMPEGDYALIAELKHRLHDVKHEAKKSELLRAGLQALALLLSLIHI